MVNHSSMPIHSPIFSSFGLKMRPTRKIRSMRTARVVLAGLLHSGTDVGNLPLFPWPNFNASFHFIKIVKLFVTSTCLGELSDMTLILMTIVKNTTLMQYFGCIPSPMMPVKSVDG